MKSLSLVVPCYNEEEVLQKTNEVLTAFIDRLVQSGRISADSCIYYVDDGSKDDTWRLIERFSRESLHSAGLKLSRNVGHQKALLAGLLAVPGDLIVSIDADLQDDVEAIERMLASCERGHDVVYGVREDRTSDTWFKRSSAQFFYKVMACLGVDVVYNHADYRLMTRRAVESLKEFQETNLFLRGLVPLIGLEHDIVLYTRAKRFAGESKYPLRRMLSFAWDGVTSFSIVPLRFVTGIGIAVFLLSVLMSLIVMATKFFTDEAVPGWASTVLPIYILGGIQLLCVGILGEYIGKVYKEVKARPRYFVEKKCGQRFE